MNFCYIDESGTGSEPIATMVGIVVDSGRMHLTKTDWADLLDILSNKVGKTIAEFHAADFYRGNGIWRPYAGPERAGLIDEILRWLTERKHHVVYAAVVKSLLADGITAKRVPADLGQPYVFMAMHLILAVQRCSQREKSNKGHTCFKFDEASSYKKTLYELACHPPGWSDEYYQRTNRQIALDQMIDMPSFDDSRHVGLIQVADLLAFILRRFAEIEGGLALPPQYPAEPERMRKWANILKARCIGTEHIYPKIKRNSAQELFYSYAPNCIRGL